MSEFDFCVIKELPSEQHLNAALHAIWHNPVNAARLVSPDRIAITTSKFWGVARAKDMTYSFMERVSTGFQKKMDLYLNRWAEFSCCRIRFTNDLSIANCRIAFENGGYYSYEGTDNDLVSKNEHTMNLQGFTLSTPDREWERVPVHEIGHFWGCGHEHRRKAIVDRLDKQAVYELMWSTQRWDRETVDQQVLTPSEERNLMGSPDADEESVMCYPFPASVTKDHRPIVGGSKISRLDREYFAKAYPPDNIITPRRDRVIVVKENGTIEIDGRVV